VALTLVTAASERHWHAVQCTTRCGPLDITARDRLADALQKVWDTAEGTDCAQPILHALAHGLGVDAFLVLTDSETWAGAIHPAEALRRYRAVTGIPARLVVVAMVANHFSLADPADAGMLDVVGSDLATPGLIADFIRG
jgi:60 kDa SS-A/Ro ribonucleoprotein